MVGQINIAVNFWQHALARAPQPSQTLLPSRTHRDRHVVRKPRVDRQIDAVEVSSTPRTGKRFDKIIDPDEQAGIDVLEAADLLPLTAPNSGRGV